MRGRKAGSVALALAAALGWATYYLFVLWVAPGTPASAVLFYPFLAGGVAYALWALSRSERRALMSIWRSAAAYLRVGLMVAMQLSILAATYLTGPVDTSLLSLIGDVVATPLLAAGLRWVSRSTVARPSVAAGLALSLAGGSITIAGGRQLAPVHGVAWLAVVAAPLAVGLYFLLSARAGESTPMSAVVSQATLGSAAVAAVLAVLMPGGWDGIVRIGPWPLALLTVNGVVSFFLAPLAYFRSIAREGYVVPPMLMTAIPVFTLVLSAGVLGLAVPSVAFVGIPIAVVGSIVTLRTPTATTGGVAGRPRSKP